MDSQKDKRNAVRPRRTRRRYREMVRSWDGEHSSHESREWRLVRRYEKFMAVNTSEAIPIKTGQSVTRTYVKEVLTIAG